MYEKENKKRLAYLDAKREKMESKGDKYIEEHEEEYNQLTTEIMELEEQLGYID